MLKRSLTLALALSLSAAAPRAASGDLLVFAAASLTDALNELAAAYEKGGGEHVSLSLGASSTLARQIEAGAPADLFLSADEAKMDDLEEHRLVLPGTRRDRLSNALVVVVPAASRLRIGSLADLARPDIRRLALADPAAVPAGIYAKSFLQQKGIWPKVSDRVVPTENVRAALAAVESGSVEAGIVYKTDAAISKKVRVAYEVPRAEGPRIAYPFAVVATSQHPDAARKLLAYLESPAASEVFQRYGFLVLGR